MIDPFILRRVEDTSPQTSLSGSKRRQNLKKAFQVWERERLAGKDVLLVDDVFTTGTTVNECARVLSLAGAGQIKVFTLARVSE